jgi:hypothetical protein
LELLYFRFYTGGPSLPSDEILSSHHVEGSPEMAVINCYSLCKKDVKCVGFNVRASSNDENCQLTNETESQNENGLEKGEWKLFRDLEVVSVKYKFPECKIL